jgi:hypothetical protein
MIINVWSLKEYCLKVVSQKCCCTENKPNHGSAIAKIIKKYLDKYYKVFYMKFLSFVFT